MTWNGTPVDPEDPSWESYRTDTSGPIPEDEWARYRHSAHEVIRDVTFGRSEETADEDELAAIQRAVYRTADALYAVDTGVVSESLGSYSYTRGRALNREDAVHEAIAAMAGTGLTYRGIE